MVLLTLITWIHYKWPQFNWAIWVTGCYGGRYKHCLHVTWYILPVKCNILYFPFSPCPMLQSWHSVDDKTVYICLYRLQLVKHSATLSNCHLIVPHGGETTLILWVFQQHMSKKTISANKEQDRSRSWDIRALKVCWQEHGETTDRN